MPLYLCLFFYLISIVVFAQEADTTAYDAGIIFFDPSKKIPEQELKNKKEGVYLTGLPRVEFDPIRSFGVGGNLQLYANKKKEDPFFAYTPYRHKINAEFFVYGNGRLQYAFNYDAPYFLNTKWRFSVDALYSEDPNAQYWGVGRKTLQPLAFTDPATGQHTFFSSMRAYEKHLSYAYAGPEETYYTNQYYNNFFHKEHLWGIKAERTMWGGKLRVAGGYEALLTSFRSYQGKTIKDVPTQDGDRLEAVQQQTLIDRERADGTWQKFNLEGFYEQAGYVYTGLLSGAVIYDTRDFEPDPSQGYLVELAHEWSSPWWGSSFDFHKTLVQAQAFRTVHYWRGGRSRLTLAGLAALGYVYGAKISFIEMWDLSSQAQAGGITVLGGGRSIRGFRESRFLAPVVALVNLEARLRFYDFTLFRQHFAIGVTPFYDAGCVWDQLSDINLQQWRGAPGLGWRLSWNQATIIRLDAARSYEGFQLFFGMGHIF
jgi:outer membrane protein assembly factor BamA